MTDVRCVWPLGAQLGEGPVWVARDAALWFTDIKRRQLHRFDPASGARSSFDTPDQPGFALPAADGSMIVGMPGGLHRFDPATRRFTCIVEVERDLPGNRLNDAVVAPSGHLWFGTMDDGETAPTGRFYRLDDDGVARPRGAPCAITNGPAFSPDGGTLYSVDTLARCVTACTVDAAGQIVSARRWLDLDAASGFPDGPSVDAEGHVWIGLYAGWAARRYAPDGTLVATVELPVANITKIAFGGPGLGTAYATTAAQKLSDAERAAQPLAGGLFAFAAPAPGLPGAVIRHGIGL